MDDHLRGRLEKLADRIIGEHEVKPSRAIQDWFHRSRLTGPGKILVIFDTSDTDPCTVVIYSERVRTALNPSPPNQRSTATGATFREALIGGLRLCREAQGITT